jgi:hypothetical protein
MVIGDRIEIDEGQLFKGKLCTHTSVEPVYLGQLTNITLTAKLCTHTHIEPLYLGHHTISKLTFHKLQNQWW